MPDLRLLERAPGARLLLALAVGCGLLSARLVVVETLLLSAVVGAAFQGTRPTAAIPGLLVAMAVVVAGAPAARPVPRRGSARPPRGA